MAATVAGGLPKPSAPVMRPTGQSGAVCLLLVLLESLTAASAVILFRGVYVQHNRSVRGDWAAL